jgi:hypothetical protein
VKLEISTDSRVPGEGPLGRVVVGASSPAMARHLPVRLALRFAQPGQGPLESARAAGAELPSSAAPSGSDSGGS